jgi:hypothetical protein
LPNKFGVDINRYFCHIFINFDFFSNKMIELQWHPVIKPAFHTLIRVTPDDPAPFKNEPLLTNLKDNQGRIYFTFGAGPELNNGSYQLLIKGINRSSDKEEHSGKYIVIEIPGDTEGETAFIRRLFALHNNYANNANYDMFPAPDGDGYNSNSYVAGLLKAAGVSPPQPNVDAPGFSKPLPEVYFTMLIRPPAGFQTTGYGNRDWLNYSVM